MHTTSLVFALLLQLCELCNASPQLSALGAKTEKRQDQLGVRLLHFFTHQTINQRDDPRCTSVRAPHGLSHAITKPLPLSKKQMAHSAMILRAQPSIICLVLVPVTL
jgi:hypothetical protein